MGLCRAVVTTSVCALFLELYMMSKPEEIVKEGQSTCGSCCCIMPISQLLF